MIAVNPKTVVEVDIEGVKFKIGILPFGKRVEIQSLTHFNREGVNSVQMQELLKQSYEYVRWGVKGHSDLKYVDGSIVEFKSEKAKVGEVEYDIVSQETMEIYAAGSKILSALCTEVIKFNYASGDELKK
jgi:hypothetical protein